MKKHLEMARSGISIQLYPFFGHRFHEARLQRKARILSRNMKAEKMLRLQSSVSSGKILTNQSPVKPTAAKGLFYKVLAFLKRIKTWLRK